MDFIHNSISFFMLICCAHLSAGFSVPCGFRHAHRCDDGSCIYFRRVCDGIIDCPDGSDEKELNETYDEKYWVPCTRKFSRRGSKCLLPRKYTCDNYAHCMEDECNCSLAFRCSDTECISVHFYCDGVVDCSNGADEMEYRYNEGGNIQCYGSKMKPCALAPINVCNGKHECIHNEDECFCDGSDRISDMRPVFNERCFRCLDGNGVIARDYVCDNYFHCSDLSDECLCENPLSTCNQLEYKGECEFRCQSSEKKANATDCIKKTEVCDWNRDCFLGEDEKYCNAAGIASLFLSIYYPIKLSHEEFWCCNAGHSADCLYSHTFTNATHDGCDQFYACPPDYMNKVKYAIKCDGTVTCGDGSDECHEDCEVDGRPSKFCDEKEKIPYFFCDNSSTESFYAKSFWCDGNPTCDIASPEESVDEKDCPNRFYCLSEIMGALFVSIDQDQICDCIPNCFDGSDEANCSNYKNFCCENGAGYVPHNKVCDGVADCRDKSDECQSCIVSPFADDRFIIKSKPLQAFVWITGAISVAGNIFMITKMVENLRDTKAKRIRRTNSIQLIGLAVADFSVGIYLLSLGIVNAVYAGSYCRVDYEWRSGNACNAMGVVSTLGIEASVFMLTTITANRLYSVLKPFSHPPGVRRTIFFVVIVYVAALTFSIVPVSSLTEDFFLENVRMSVNPFFRPSVDRKNFSEFANKLSSFGNEKLNFSFTLGETRNFYSWNVLYEVAKQMSDTFKPEFEFGFYSTHGVCLPKFFPSDYDSSRHYSMFLISINFVSFLFILVSYIVIYRTRKQSVSEAGQDADQTSLQRKITRIIVTDFMCWMPVCLVAFLKFSGVPISSDVYEVAAIVILPINSALNPFLYSDLSDIVWKKATTVYQSLRQCDRTNIFTSPFTKDRKTQVNRAAAGSYDVTPQ